MMVLRLPPVALFRLTALRLSAGKVGVMMVLLAVGAIGVGAGVWLVAGPTPPITAGGGVAVADVSPPVNQVVPK